ncbi:toll/interleukin-1 receptor domain-containing protein [Aeromonas veronii]|uniref:toll/interleukin-1 receptor domain-containing protein n=1 Tax=Aeromonas TaxID=642 RepID=UPI00191FA01F|nr:MULTISPECIES: toll/interleukin-1 receptor domain-containing protein [Aeromonas]MBL0473229.1 toll/interleukin-1 receptor domain-containing protein [Aeromonas veronii]MCO5342790.1 toll/interleukin-1 receptor domain-containing protein [Aeromonas veronii]
MNGLEKIELIDAIAVELQSRMTFSDIDVYFSGHKVPTENNYPTNSKRSYSKDMLSKVSDEVIFKIAEELSLEIPMANAMSTKEVTFWKAGHFKLFLSHLASFKVQTSHLQSALRKYAISSFVAHEDIEPTKQWQEEIEAALHTMDALVAILMPGFQESRWCDQEVGFAVGRDVLVIPLRKGLDPYGFIGKYQGIQAQNKTIGDVAEAIFRTLIKSPKTKNKILMAMSGAVSNASSPEEALDKVSILKSLDNISVELLDSLKQDVSDNPLLMESQGFINAFNALLSKFGIQKLNHSKQEPEMEWEDIPF